MREDALQGLAKPKKLIIVLLVYLLLFAGVVSLFFKLSKKNSFDELVFKNKDYKFFEEQVVKIGAKKSYDLLKKRFPGNDPDAHDFAHSIGYVAYYEKGDEGISVCDTMFNYGCYHGFMIKFFFENGTGEIKKMENACNKLGKSSTPSCIHGIGHGLMMEAGYNLDLALTNCEPIDKYSRPYCWDGIFMERIAGSMQEVQERYKPNEVNLDEPCRSVEFKFRRECWRNQVSVWFNYYNMDGQKAGSRCVVAEAEFRDICFESVGLKLTQAYGEDTSKLVNMCSFVDARAYSRCLVGVMRELMFERKSIDVARSMCERVDTNFSQECFSNFSKSLEEYKERF